MNHMIKGYTLIELLISIGVLGLVSGVIISSFLSLNAAYDKADVVVKVNHEGSRIMEQISRLIRSANEAEPVVNGTNIILTIPADTANLEYAANGNCTQVEIYLNSNTLNKRSIGSSCVGTPVCSVASPCVLTSTDVYVNEFTINVTNYTNQPDIVSINLRLQQKQSLSDPQQQSSMAFERVVSTRGYR